MPFRERAKNLFKTKSRRDDSLSTTATNESNHDVYQPGEAMPPPKYRRAPQKEHKDKLEAFSFADAWRKKSFQSSHSPMGTRASSRRTSMWSLGRKSLDRKSLTRPIEPVNTNSTVTSGEAVEDVAARQKESVGGAAGGGGGPAIKFQLPSESGQKGERDGADGLSPTQSKEKGSLSRPRTQEGKQPGSQLNGVQKATSTAKDHQPFSEQDIAKAMQQSHSHSPEISVQS